MYQLRDVLKVRSAGGVDFRLRIPRMDIDLGARVALVGHSGCGKSTVLDMLALVLSPSECTGFRFAPGETADSNDIAGLWRADDSDRLGELRKHHIGYVLQTGGLLPYLTVRENITLSRRLLGLDQDNSTVQLAERLDIANQLDKLPAQLSVGQRQRVAIGRALAHRPATVIADEPTASIDPLTAEKIMRMFVELADEMRLTLIVASHELELIDRVGLRRIEHRFERLGGDGVTESVFSD